MPDRLMKFAPLLIVTGILTCLGCLSQTGPGSTAPGTVASSAPVAGSVGDSRCDSLPGWAQPQRCRRGAVVERRCDSPPLPAWAGQTVPLQAVGRSTVSQEDADKSARLGVIKNLEVRVDGVDRTSQQETSAAGFSYRVSSVVVETVHITVSGLEILQRHTDPCGPHYYALARLDRDQAVHAWSIDLKALDERHGELSRQASTAQEQGEVLRALELWHQALEADATAEQLDRRLRYLAPRQGGGGSGAARVEQARQRMTALLTSLKLMKVSGDGQRAKPGKPLPDPLTVQVVSIFQGQERPLSDIPIVFSFEVGRGEVDSPLRTNPQGRAEAHVRGIEAGSASVVVSAKVGMDHVGRTIPSALQDQLTRHLAGQTVRFSLTPPPLALDQGPLAQALHDLALRLSAQVNDSDGALTAVQGFFENRTKQRLAFSARLETGLAAGLSRFAVLQVIDGEQVASDATAKSVTNREVTAQVFGVYEADAAGGLWLSAKLVRLRDHVMEATAEGTIPRTAFSEQDWRELHGVKVDNRPPVAPAGSGQAEQFHRWVEAFWDLRNPSGFHTELVADRPQYRIGEKAGFRFRTTEDCYLTVVSIGVSGSWIVLSPNQYRSDLRQTLVRAADGWVPIPHPTQDRFEFTVDRPLGTERIKTICTKQPVALVRNMDFSRGYVMVTAADAAAIGGITWSDLVAQGTRWSEAHAGIVTLETGETGTKGSRALKARGLVTP